jgi:hypothetical protein
MGNKCVLECRFEILIVNNNKKSNMKNIIKYLTVISVVAAFAACSQYGFDPADISLKSKKKASTTTIAFLESNYMVTDQTVPGYFTADRISSADTLVFNGIVTSNDLMGNQYKYIVVQEDDALTATPRAIRVSIDANNVANLLPPGQHVSVIANGWCIGKYGNCPQMGTYYVRPKDDRLSPGAMPMPIVRKTVIAYGDLAPQELVPQEMTVAEINTYKTHHLDLDWKLIKIKNIHFTQLGDAVNSPNKPAGRIIFAPGTDGIGYPQAIQISDGTGTIDICTSEYSKFAQTTIPSADYVGDVICIVSWYQSRPNVTGSFQLTMRSLHDLDLTNPAGEKWTGK